MRQLRVLSKLLSGISSNTCR